MDRITADGRFDVLADHLTYIEQIEEDISRNATRGEHIRAERLRQHVGELKRLRKRQDAEDK